MHTTLRTAVFGLLLITALPLLGDAPRIVTLVLDPAQSSAQLQIESYEAFRVVSSKLDSPWFKMTVTKESREFTFTSEDFNGRNGGYFFIPPKPVIFSGPATIQLSITSGVGVGGGTLTVPISITVEITPQSFPPDKTILVPPGTNQVAITLECSTNLVQWSPATNGVYGPMPEAKFFRIKAQPVN